MKKYLAFLVFVGCCTSVYAGNRKCVSTGASARCGDAKTVVKCEGYDQAYHLDDNEKIANLGIRAYLNSDWYSTEDLFTIDSPLSEFRAYSIVLAWYKDQIINGNNIDKVSPDYLTAFEDIAKSVQGHELPVGIRSLVLGSFEISQESNLYLDCYMEKGIAPRSSN